MKDGGEEKKGTSGGECYGDYNSSTGTGSGAGYVNACIHSGSTEHSGGNTVWYNYGTASAGTIKSSSASDTTGTTVITTESVCPKGWTLPSQAQIDNQRDVNSFFPVLGGYYTNGTLYEPARGYWWGSTAGNGASRYALYSDGSSLDTDSRGYRRDGLYIRCVSEEKDVSDLTYMQDMTPSIATSILARLHLLKKIRYLNPSSPLTIKNLFYCSRPNPTPPVSLS